MARSTAVHDVRPRAQSMARALRSTLVLGFGLALALLGPAAAETPMPPATVAAAATQFNQFLALMHDPPTGDRAGDLARIQQGRRLAASPELVQVASVELTGSMLASIDDALAVINKTPAGTDYRALVAPRAQVMARIAQGMRDRLRTANGGKDVCTVCGKGSGGSPSSPTVSAAAGGNTQGTGSGNPGGNSSSAGSVELVGITASNPPPAGSSGNGQGAGTGNTGPGAPTGSGAPDLTAGATPVTGDGQVEVVMGTGGPGLPNVDGTLAGSPSVVLSAADVDQLAQQVMAALGTAQQNGARLVVQQVAGDVPGQTSVVIRLDQSGALPPPVTTTIPLAQAPAPQPPDQPGPQPVPDPQTTAAVGTSQMQQALYEAYGSVGFLFPSDPGGLAALLGFAPGPGAYKYVRIDDRYGLPMKAALERLQSGPVHDRFPAEVDRIAAQMKKMREANYSGTWGSSVPPESLSAFQADVAQLKAMMDDLYQKVETAPAS